MDYFYIENDYSVKVTRRTKIMNNHYLVHFRVYSLKQHRYWPLKFICNISYKDLNACIDEFVSQCKTVCQNYNNIHKIIPLCNETIKQYNDSNNKHTNNY